MNSIKLIDFLQQIPKEDLNFLNKYYSNVINNEYKFLFHAINSVIVNNNEYNSTLLWKLAFGKEKFDDAKLRKLCFNLFRDIEIQLGNRYINSDESLIQIEFINYLATNVIDDFFEPKIEKYRNQELKKINISSSRVYHNFRINNIYYNYLINHPVKSKQHNIIELADSLDVYYHLKQLKLMCHAINEKIFTKFEKQLTFQDRILENIKNSYLIEHPLINVYFHTFELLSNTNDTHLYHKVKQIIFSSSNIDGSELKILYQYLINYAIVQINKSNEIFNRELFDVFVKQLAIFPNETISPFRFKNITNLGLKIKEYKFVDEFIEDYSSQLPKHEKAITVAFCRASWYFEQKQYSNTIDILNSIKTDDLTFNLSSKRLIIKSFYEQKEFQFLDSYTESFRIYILRNKQMNVVSKKLYQEFIRLINQLIKKEYANDKAIEKYKQKIMAIPNLPDKAWILEKTQEL